MLSTKAEITSGSDKCIDIQVDKLTYTWINLLVLCLSNYVSFPVTTERFTMQDWVMFGRVHSSRVGIV